MTEALARLKNACAKLDAVCSEAEHTVDLAMAKFSSTDEPRILELQDACGVNEISDGGDDDSAQ